MITRWDKPFAPADRKETVRRRILSLLSGRPLTARQISAEVGIPEKEAYEHLPHIKRTVARLGGRLAVTPAECRQCGYLFRKRERPNRPGRCPVCRGESISEPLFAVEVR
jgi:predicted Zn-ribbon and HTH transcriptional regulator